ncbi:methyltransferase [Actinomadura nitritigenes]|uniref:methyltransferase n=1 Tax=Actinomadura nitritigenes TaxID=134602 RepID=UPI003D949C5F
MQVTDPTALYRLRDGAYAADLLIAAVAGLDLFSWLAEQEAPVPDGAVVLELGLAARPTDVMLTYLAALGLIDRADGAVSPTRTALDHLSAGSRYDLRSYYASLASRPGCKELLDVLRTGEPSAWASADGAADWSAHLDDPAAAAAFTSAMDARGHYLAPVLAETVADLDVGAVLDIGGSSGTYACALADRLGVTGAVLERSPVDHAARTLIADRGQADRIQVVTADMFADPLPGGYRTHLYSHVLHDWPEEKVRALLAASYRALPPGGLFIDHDVHINAAKTGPLPAAEYSVLLMHSTHGKCWSTAELAAFLRDAGFTSVEERTTAADRSALIVRTPG